MATRIVCPQCRDKLKLHKPAIDSTRVKCRACGHKFYAGKAETWGGDDVPSAGSFHPMPGTATNDATPATQDQTVAVAHAEPHERRSHQRSHRSHEMHLPRWVIPAGIGCLVVFALAGIFLSQKPPPPPEPGIIETAKAKAKAKREAQGDETVAKSKNAFRPKELIGIWQTNQPKGGLLDFAADGTIHVRGAFLDQNVIDSTSRWYTVRMYGETYDLEIGPEPKLATNHAMRLELKPDGTLVMKRYASSANMSLEERVFTKAK